MDEPIRWPTAIYFDASALRQLPFDLSSPDLARLNEVVTRFGIGKFVPEVAEREWIWFHQEIAKKKRDSLMSTARMLADYAKEMPFNVEGPDERELLEEVRRAQADRLSSAGFERIPTPPADLTELLESAIRRIKPFEDGDRGFRDTIVNPCWSNYHTSTVLALSRRTFILTGEQTFEFAMNGHRCERGRADLA
jgi:hypothetical protein